MTKARKKRSKKSRQLTYSCYKSRNRGFIKYPAACHADRLTEWLPGKYDSAESREAYEKSAGYYMLHGTVPPWVGTKSAKTKPSTTDQVGPASLTVAQLCGQFADERLPRYAKAEQAAFRIAMRRLCYSCGNNPVATIGHADLRQARKLFVAAGNCVNYVNQQVNRIRSVFAFGLEEDLVPAAVISSLAVVKGLKRGDGKVYPEKKAVSDAVVRETCEHLPQAAVDLITVIRHSGSRPGEMFGLKVGDIIQHTPDLWRYEPEDHKNAQYGHSRTIRFGPRCIAILKRLTAKRKASDYVFVRPEQTDYRNKRRHAKTAGKPWDRHCFHHIIARTCKANDIPHWHPHQLRHAAASEAYNRKNGAAAAAQALLGHSRLSTTDRYITLDESPADREARNFG